MAKRVFVALLVLITLTSVYSITRASVPVAEAAAPTTLNFQARLLNTSGSLVNDGNYSIEFKIYNASSSSGSSQGSCTGDANCLWTETRTGGNQIQIKNGYISAYLGDVSSLPTNIWNQQLWLTMNIHNGTTWDGEMTPRIRLTSVPYAFRATIAESAETLSKNTGSFTGTVDFATMTADRKFLFPDTSLATTASPGTICVYNGAASNCPAASGSAYYIQNDTVLQSASNFHIQARNSTTNGTVGGVISGAAGGQTVDLLQFRASDDSTVLAAVTANGNLQVASSVDTRTATTLNLGTSTATAISIAKSGVTTTIEGALTVDEASTLNGDVTVAAQKTIRFVGGTTAQRPISPSEGMLYFDTDTHQLVQYNGTKWVSDRSSSTKIVAPAGASQTVKDSADYVANGTTDQSVINNALNAAAGGTVLLLPGTYTATGAILIPNNTTLAGSGANTTKIMLNAGSSSVNLIENGDTTDAIGIGVKDLTLDNSLSTGGIQNGISLDDSDGSGDVTDSLMNLNLTAWDDITSSAVALNDYKLRTFAGNNVSGNVSLSSSALIDNFFGNNIMASVSIDSSTINSLSGNNITGAAIVDNSTVANITSNTIGAGLTTTDSLIYNFVGNSTVESSITHPLGPMNVSNNTITGTSSSSNLLTLTNTDKISIIGNKFIDGASTSGKAISIDAGTDSAYVSDNTLDGLGIDDNGTNTIYGGQIDEAGNYLIQPTGTIELLTDTNVTGTLAASVAVHAPLFDTAAAAALNIGTVNATNITIGHNAGTFAVDGTNFDLSTAGVLTLAGGQTNDITTQTNQNLTIQANGTGTIVLNDTTTLNGTATFSGVSTDITTGTNEDLTVVANGTGTINLNDTVTLGGTLTFSGVSSDITTASNEDLTIDANGSGIINLNDTVSVAGNFTVTNAGNVAFQNGSTADITTGGTFTDYAIGTGALFRFDGASAQTISSISGGSDGRIITLINASPTYALTIQNDTGGTAGNRIITGTGGNLSVPTGATIQLAYDSDSSRWRVIGGTATSGGGANQQLSNLSGTIAINASLTPNADNTLDLGSSSFSWKTLYADTSVLTPLIDTVTAGALGIGTTNATNITIGHNAGTFAVDGTNFDLSTAGVLTLAGGQTNDITTSANTNLTLQANGTGTISLNDTVSVAGTMTFSGVTTDITTGTNEDLTVVANGSGTIILNDTVTANGTLTFNGVTTDITTSTNEDLTVVANGSGIIALNDNVTIGASAGSGTTFTNNGATLNATLLVNDDSDGGVLGSGLTAAQSVDIYTSFRVNQTTASQTITIPSPTNTAAGRIIYIANIGSTSFGLLGSTLNNGSTATLLWNGTTWTFAGADGTSINNQNATQQSGNFWISGSGRADTSILTPAVDTATAGPLTIGTTNATNITIGHNAGTFAVDGTNFDLSTAGVITLAGGQTTDITTQANQNLTVVANGSGTISLNDAVSVTNTLTLRDGTTDITTGTNEDLTVVANGTGIISLNDAVTVTGNFTVANTGNVAFQRNTTNYTATGTQSDINLGTGALFRITSASALTINSIANGADGRIITLVNASSNPVTIANDTGSTAPNRIMTGTGASTIIPVDGSIELAYDSSSARWRVIGGTALNGGGANQQLSNLSGTIAINASLTPNADNTLDLGSSSFSWKTLYADTSVLTPLVDTASAAALNIGTTNATNITIGHNAGTFAVDGTNFDLSTAGVITLAGGQTNDITTQANQNLTMQANGTGTIVLNDTITANGTLTFSGVATDITTGTNEDLTVVANGTGTIILNDNVTIGSSAGSGTTLTNNGATVNTALAVANDADGGVLGGGLTAAQSVNIYTSFTVNQTTTGQSITIPSPTNTAAGRIIYIANIGSASFGLLGSTLNNGSTATLLWNGTAWTFAGADGTSINNQIAAAQNGDFWIQAGGSSTGIGRLDGKVLTPVVDTATATTLSVGTTTANAISIGKVGATTTNIGNLTVGASAGSGTVFVNNGATLNATLPVSNDTDGGVLGGGLTAALSVDIYTTFTVNQTTASQTITIPSPTNTAAGRLIYIANVGSTSFGLLGSTLNNGSTATLLWNGTAWTFAGADGTSINNQKTAGQNGDFWIQSGGSSTGIGRADGGLQAPSLDTASAAALAIGTTNATNITIGHNAGTFAVDGTNFDLSTTGVITLAGGQTKDITTANASTATGITIKPGNSTGSNVVGPTLTLQGGAATAGNANGGAVTISGGAGFGTGTQGLVNLATSAFTSASEQSFSSSTSITAGNVDLYSSLPVKAVTNTGLVLTVPDPAQNAVGRLLYIAARSGSLDFTLRLNSSRTPIDISMKQNSTATLIWNGTDWTAAGASSSTDLQAAYNNTLTSAGGAELVLNAPGSNADGLTIRNNATTAITGALLEVQTSVGTNLLSVNNNATEYAQNGGAESGSGTSFTNGWSASANGGTQATVTRETGAGNFVTGLASVKVTAGGATANQGAADQIAVNGTNTALTANLTYTVSFAVKGTSNFNTLAVVYSKDGTNTSTTSCTSGQTVTQSVWSRITCTFSAPSSGITSSNAIFIRQTDSGTSRVFYIDNLSVNIGAAINHAADGDADSAANIGGGTNNWASVNTATVSQVTTPVYNTNGAVSVVTSATAGRGVYNKLSNNIAPNSAVATQYRVAFYARGDGTNTATLGVTYTPDNGSTNIACQDYNTQVATAGAYQLISCYFTTTTATVTNAQIRITQSSGSATTFYVDGLSVTLNTNNSNNVQIGGANTGGPTTLLTLDRASTAPIAANNDAYLGSMYYDTTTGRIQCYEADGWGACGSAPDNIIVLTPEYTGAVLNGNGVGVMTADFCATSAALTVGTLCANNTSRQYYTWTSPQATEQVYSIYVSYKLPSTFKNFNSDDTINLTARTSNTTTGHVTYEVFRSSGSAITACGTETAVTNTTDGANFWSTKPINGNEATSCSFAANDNVVFKINMKSYSSANVYVENLTFTYTNN